ncbi:hypothetical protein HDU88_005406 [Geranomyces variabilis]|nr:hypothetical protein HDU88_005406 [Geranomyces variabilis]
MDTWVPVTDLAPLVFSRSDEHQYDHDENSTTCACGEDHDCDSGETETHGRLISAGVDRNDKELLRYGKRLMDYFRNGHQFEALISMVVEAEPADLETVGGVPDHIRRLLTMELVCYCVGTLLPDDVIILIAKRLGSAIVHRTHVYPTR